jgi:hypothetical protein
MLDTRRDAFMERMAFGTRPRGGERPPTPKEMLIVVGTMVGLANYMVTVVFLITWMLGGY